MQLVSAVLHSVRSGQHSSSSRPQPAPDRIPFRIEILAQFFEGGHGSEQTDQLQHLYDGLVFHPSVFVSSLHVWEHLIAVRLLYGSFGSRPGSRSHETVLGCTARSKIALKGQERISEEEPSEVWFATNQIC